jgi:hypothetical protein
VAFELKTPWREGTTHLGMTPVDFMERLAALVPRPRLHLIRFHGVLAPNAKLRALVVPRVVRSIYEDTELSEVPRHRRAAALRSATSWLPPSTRPYAYFGLMPISSRQAREPSRTRKGRQNHNLLKICGFI